MFVEVEVYCKSLQIIMFGPGNGSRSVDLLTTLSMVLCVYECTMSVLALDGSCRCDVLAPLKHVWLVGGLVGLNVVPRNVSFVIESL